MVQFLAFLYPKFKSNSKVRKILNPKNFLNKIRIKILFRGKTEREANLGKLMKKLRMIEEDSTALENQWKNLTRNQKRSEEKIRFNESSAL